MWTHRQQAAHKPLSCTGQTGGNGGAIVPAEVYPPYHELSMGLRMPRVTRRSWTADQISLLCALVDRGVSPACISGAETSKAGRPEQGQRTRQAVRRLPTGAGDAVDKRSTGARVDRACGAIFVLVLTAPCSTRISIIPTNRALSAAVMVLTRHRRSTRTADRLANSRTPALAIARRCRAATDVRRAFWTGRTESRTTRPRQTGRSRSSEGASYADFFKEPALSVARAIVMKSPSVVTPCRAQCRSFLAMRFRVSWSPP